MPLEFDRGPDSTYIVIPGDHAEVAQLNLNILDLGDVKSNSSIKIASF